MGLIFDGVDIEAEFNVMIDGASSWPKPARRSDTVQVPGRNGDLLYDDGAWENVEITYNILVKAEWITDMFRVLPVEFPRISAVMWFNQSKSFEADWALDTSSAAVDAWKNGIAALS